MEVEHEAPWYGDEDEGVVEKGDDGGRGDVILETSINTILSFANVRADDTLGYGEASSKYGKPGECKKSGDVSVFITHSSDAEEEEKRCRWHRNGEEPVDYLFKGSTVTGWCGFKYGAS